MASADDQTATRLRLSPGQASNGSEGWALLEKWEHKLEALPERLSLAMDKAYEGDETRVTVTKAGFVPAVSPKDNRREPREYDKALYRRRNEVE